MSLQCIEGFRPTKLHTKQTEGGCGLMCVRATVQNRATIYKHIKKRAHEMRYLVSISGNYLRWRM